MDSRSKDIGASVQAARMVVGRSGEKGIAGSLTWSGKLELSSRK